MMSGSRRAALPPKAAPPPWELFWGHRPVQARGQGCPVEGDRSEGQTHEFDPCLPLTSPETWGSHRAFVVRICEVSSDTYLTGLL